MCGIAGIVTLERPTSTEDVAAVKRMMDAQVHRGPDGAGLHQAPHAVLGHRRLSIIDLSEAGRQPMSNEDGTIWVTYNGEIYNFLELREELRLRDHCFKSRTDTEVLVHGYEEWGIEGLLNRLRGMFAFALYDGRGFHSSPCLFLAKDRFGIKPLYYAYQSAKQIVFASEVRALLKSGLVPDQVNTNAIVRFLQMGSVPVPLTTIKDVAALPAAHYAILDDRGLRQVKYWDLAALFSDYLKESPPLDVEDTRAGTRALLDETVQFHLLSDVPLGVFLSGGIDSSALVALASSVCTQPLRTVSIVFEEKEYSEVTYSRMVAAQYRTDHHEMCLRSDDLLTALPDVFAAMDQPTVDGVNSFFVSRAARQAGLTVVLSGTGGDEVFLGYPHLKRGSLFEALLRLYGGMPATVRCGLVRLAMGGAALAGKSGAEKLSYLEKPSKANIYWLTRGLFTSRQIQELLGVNAGLVDDRSPVDFPPNGTAAQGVNACLNLYEFQHYLQNQLLKDVDCMSMSFSLETRVPFLDHKLVEYVASLPRMFKLHAGINKPLLVQSIGKGFPRLVWDRRKMGFTFPLGPWLKGQAAILEDYCVQQKIMDPQAVRAIWSSFKKGRTHWSRPWGLVVASRWGA